MRTIIAVAMHKPAALPADPVYLPVQAGAALQPPLGVQRDDEGEGISERNPLYCELTAHYWLWHNAEADALGLCHYRRYFTRRPFGRALSGALTGAEAEALLADADVIVPRPRPYLIETNESHYAHAHRAGDLALARRVISARCPDFLPAFDRVMKRRWGRRFNMCIMRRDAFAGYSAWLFGILADMEAQLGADAPPRVLGYIAERLMDVWLDKEQPRMRQLRVLHTEGQQWPRRIAGFLRRKFFPSKWRLPKSHPGGRKNDQTPVRNEPCRTVAAVPHHPDRA